MEARWQKLCETIGVEGGREWERITQAYREPGRAYHNLDHIADCLTQLDRHGDAFEDVVSVEFAFWFHDVVYDTRANDNEERSADWACNFLDGQPCTEKVRALILSTKHHQPIDQCDGALIVDIDLSILGSDSDRYDLYAKAIREEYHWVENSAYRKGRGNVLRSFLDREFIYHTPSFRKDLETMAQQNIRRELEAY
ncbi:MAG: N-methyl-D-aspartate receptor NMDAR2C subunit [Verrucomicrobiota bacterium]